MADTVTSTKLSRFLLPSLGSDMESGTVTEWLVSPGDQVHKGDVLVRVDTEKAEIDVEIWHDAIVAELLVPVGEQVPVGTPLAHLDLGAVDQPERSVEPVTPPTAEHAAEPEPKVEHTPAKLAGKPENQGDRADPRMVYWPAPRSMARPAAAAPAAPTSARPQSSAAGEVRTREERRQDAVSALMEQANRDIPHFHVTREIDVTDALAWLECRNDGLAPSDRILPAALLLYGVAQAAQNSAVNGTFDSSPDDSAEVAMGVAVHLRGGGLVTPVVAGAQNLSLDGVMEELKAKVKRARSGRMSASDLVDASITVTNLGDAGADRVLGIIRPPQRALVGFGSIRQQPRVVDSQIVVRSVVPATVTADHRVVNGHAAARFLQRLNETLGDWNPPTTDDTDDTDSEGAAT